MRAHYVLHVTPVTRGLDPALVFGEILGVIEGSRETIGTEGRCLDRDTYLSSSRRGMFRQGIFRQGESSHTREVVYDLFTAYTKLKQQYHEYDAADRLAPPEGSPNGKLLKLTIGHTVY